MLKEYKEKYIKQVIQYLIVDYNGLIVKSDHTLFSKIENKSIIDVHPFFETILPLLSMENEETVFSCVHLKINNKEITADIILQTFDAEKKPLIIIHDLTVHYNNYQTTAQVKNESIINSEILELKNTFLKEKEAFKNIFIANFSHELRDPLTGILTFTDILSKTDLDTQQKDYIQIINSSSNFLKKMIDDILDISKIESGKLELEIEPFNFIELLNEIKYNYKIKAEQKNLAFKHNFDEKLPKIVGGDAKRLRQVLNNLLENAIKFTNKGSITFNVSLNQIRAQKASIHFEVVDTGIGIKKENFEAIFTSFNQLNNDENHKGTGLGLAIVKHLVGLTNSKITIDSTYGEGSSFSTNINFLANPSLELKTNRNQNLKPLNITKKHSILLVEDSEITQLAVLKILASQGHYFLDIVSNPEDAIARISSVENEIDLVLMDIKLKEYRGDDIAKQIRKLPERHQRKVPIIAMTAKVFKEDLNRYKKAGINAVLKKPFNETQLLDVIRQHLK
ncbi:ATP-binding protein [Lacinutrix chionoecetis]